MPCLVEVSQLTRSSLGGGEVDEKATGQVGRLFRGLIEDF
jgi:hypothetical protein